MFQKSCRLGNLNLTTEFLSLAGALYDPTKPQIYQGQPIENNSEDNIDEIDVDDIM